METTWQDFLSSTDAYRKLNGYGMKVFFFKIIDENVLRVIMSSKMAESDGNS